MFHEQPIIFDAPGMETKPTTDIIFKLGIRAARIADLIAGKMLSLPVAPKARRVSEKQCSA